MSFLGTVLLGGAAGLTIFIGLPAARARVLSRRAQGFLNAVASGILFFILWEVLDKAGGTVDRAAASGPSHWGRAVALAACLLLGMAAGLMSLIYFNTFLQRQTGRPTVLQGPGAAVQPRASTAPGSHWIALAIAIGLGLHNLSEGLAIGQSAALGQISFTGVLVVGFALHNITEGFGIAAPMAGDEHPPSWGFLVTVGAVGGVPTLLGTVVGRAFTSVYLSVLFLSLAAGALIYVINEMAHVGRRLNSPAALGWGILVGFAVALLTDLMMSTARF